MELKNLNRNFATRLTLVFQVISQFLFFSVSAQPVINKVDFTGGTGNSWIGVTSSDWNTASNWSRGVVPTADDHVTILSGTPFPLIIPNGLTVNCKSAKILTGATITIQATGHLIVGQ